jgi:Sporulation and spore germination
MVATAALRQLLAGPTATERGNGYWSFFSDATATMLRGVRIANGVARADFADFSRIIPNASSSSGSAALLAELDATLKQFGTVRTTVYSFNGDVAAFYEWLQTSGTQTTELGAGYVTGGGDALRPFSGRISFKQPSTSSG